MVTAVLVACGVLAVAAFCIYLFFQVTVPVAQPEVTPDIPTIDTDALTDAVTVDGILNATTIPWSSQDDIRSGPADDATDHGGG